MEYTTQMDAARKGILTEELKKVAEKEQFDPEKLRELVAQERQPYRLIRTTNVWSPTASDPC